jgi:hypothetical protein
MKTWINGKIVDLSTEEIAVIEAERKEWNDAKPTRQLAEIRKIRNRKLTETDWKVISAKEKGTNLTTSFKTWRDNLRNIPTDYDSSKYDELLARDDDGNLTHSVWSE